MSGQPKNNRSAVNIETNTVTKHINIKWSINKQTIDIAKLSSKGDKKGVIEISVEHKYYTFNLELCVPGWRRSQDGFSAFYLTVPRPKRLDTNNNNNNNDNNSNDDNDTDIDDISDNENNDFIARYTVTFGQNENKLSRESSVRNDFGLGVGFPNFTEVATLSNAIYGNILEFLIEIEIFECESIIKNCSYLDKSHVKEIEHRKGITSKLVEKMYNDKLNCDAVIITNYINKKGIKQEKYIKVHKCILTAASPVMEILFKHKSAENITSSIIMNEWNINTVQSMIKFIYLGKIELINDDIDDIDDIIDIDIAAANDNNDDNNDDDEDEVKYEQELLLSEENKQENKQESIMRDLELECPESARALFALFQIAECYKIKELSIACCHELITYITPKTCCLFLIYLDKYTNLNDKIQDIKNYILRFMVDNITILQKSKGYLYLLQNKPYLLNQLITEITSKV